MLFNSYEFLFYFLPVVFFGFFLLARISHRLAALWLAVASLYFYGAWNPTLVPLLLGSISFNYAAGYAIAKTKNRTLAKTVMITAVTANLALLGYYKYANFFIATIDASLGTGFDLAHIILPLGISFFTFTQIAFLVDVYRGIAKEYNFTHYVLFVSYFPHLIAGPLLHHKEMMPQFAAPSTYRMNAENVALGLFIFVIGLAKKTLLADSFAEYANPVFDATGKGVAPGFAVAWTGALAYTLQLYFDFSGYSDMAIGLSRMFGIVLPINFYSPYKAANIIEFWRRWHMTLSRFLRDYLYFPLGGNRLGPMRRYANLMVTMLLGGLWHGASWTFVAWGGLHGLYLVCNHAWHSLRNRLGWPAGRPTLAGQVVGIAITFLAVVAAWVFFRAESFEGALRMLSGMAALNSGASLHAILVGDFAAIVFPSNSFAYMVGLLSLGLGLIWLAPNTSELVERVRFRSDPVTFGAIGSFFVWIFMFAIVNASRGVSEFIYFNF